MFCCGEIPIDAPCDLTDAIMLFVGTVLGVDREGVAQDYSSGKNPEIVTVSDLGENSSTHYADFSTAFRALRIRINDSSKLDAVQKRASVRSALLNECGFITQLGGACVKNIVDGPIRKQPENFFSAEMTVQFQLTRVQ